MHRISHALTRVLLIGFCTIVCSVAAVTAATTPFIA